MQRLIMSRIANLSLSLSRKCMNGSSYPCWHITRLKATVNSVW